MNTLIFYAGMLYENLSNKTSVPNYVVALPNEIYQGGYIYMPWLADERIHWHRCDLTPVLLEDVPKELRALALLYT